MTHALAILDRGEPVERDLGEPVEFLRAPDGSLWVPRRKVAEWLGFSPSHFSKFVQRTEVAEEVKPHARRFRLETPGGAQEITAYSEEGTIVLLLQAPTARGREVRAKVAARGLRPLRRLVGPPLEKLKALLEDTRAEAKELAADATTLDERGTFADADDLLGEARQVADVAGALADPAFSVPLGGYGLAGPERARTTFLRLLGGDDQAEHNAKKRGDR